MPQSTNLIWQRKILARRRLDEMQKVDFVVLDVSAQLPLVQAGLDNHEVTPLSWFCEQFTPEPDATPEEKVLRRHSTLCFDRLFVANGDAYSGTLSKCCASANVFRQSLFKISPRFWPRETKWKHFFRLQSWKHQPNTQNSLFPPSGSSPSWVRYIWCCKYSQSQKA